MSTLETVKSLEEHSNKLFVAMKKTLELLHQNDPSRTYNSATRDIKATVASRYYNSVEIINISNSKLEYSIGNIKLILVANINPIKESIEFITYEHLPDLMDITYTKKKLSPIPSLSINYKVNDITLADTKIKYSDELIAAYLSTIIDYYS
jgi:hypothetical protein